MTMRPFNTRLEDTGSFPLLVEPRQQGVSLELLFDCIDALSGHLLEHGALLIRGFGDNERLFEAFVDALSFERLSYVYRSTPRTAVSAKIFTATEYPANQHIPFHCENSYQKDWPMLLAFCCTEPAAQGGATPLADIRRVTERLPVALVDEFRSRGVCYSRYYHHGADLPWQEVFQTQDREAVAAYCRANDIGFAWHGQEELSTSQVCQGVARHPVLGTDVWFNQANLFHPSSLGSELEQMLVDMYGSDKLPRSAGFGDGGAIGRNALAEVSAAFQHEARTFLWRKSDILLIDNMQIAHGRAPFSGKRTVLVALSNSHSGLLRRLCDGL
ncbi:MAG TPA: TauD/TfdA family dioxygenase [Steroidobacteraceae bacterium]